jgi:ABC-type nitrate/sulfonate/bicarbonate transport system substrate-binding protein
MRRVVLGLAALAATVVLSSAVCADDLRLRYGQIPSTQRSVQALHLAIAEKYGLFTREGLAVEIVPIAGGTDKMVAALGQGAVDIAHTATPYLIQAVLKGSGAVAIAAETANPIYSLIAEPGVAGIGDLRGKTIGLSLAVDTISISMRKLLRQGGLRDGDYQVRELVGTPARAECLRRGDCAAVPLGQPEDFVAMEQGFRRLGLSTDAVGEFEFTVVAVRRAWAVEHRDTVVRFVRALAAAFRFIHEPANRDTVVQMIAATTGCSEAIARQIVALYLEPDRGVWPRAAEFNVKGLAQVIAFMGDAGAVQPPLPPPERFIDRQYLEAAGIVP